MSKATAKKVVRMRNVATVDRAPAGQAVVIAERLRRQHRDNRRVARQLEDGGKRLHAAHQALAACKLEIGDLTLEFTTDLLSDRFPLALDVRLARRNGTAAIVRLEEGQAREMLAFLHGSLGA